MREYNVSDEDILKAAHEALTRPPHFGYYGGNDEMFDTWGILPIGQHRDSGRLDRSNYRTILSELQGYAVAEDGDDGEEPSDFVDDFRASCFLRGWRDHITCRVLVDAEQGVTLDNLTGTFRRAIEIAAFIAYEYPIFDESDYSELESEEVHAAFDAEWDGIDWEELSPNRADENMKYDVFRKLTECEYPDSFDSEDIERAVIVWTEEFAWQDYTDTYAAQLSLFV